MDFKIINYEELPSTNQYLKENYEKYEEGTVIMTDCQTKGYGRFGRVWFSGNGQNLAFSILLSPKENINRLSLLTPLVAVSLWEVLSKYLPSLKIKWPNDLIVENKKIAGILTESIFWGRDLKAVIIGIGINVNIKSFPSELENKTTSLAIETGKDFDRHQLLKDCLDNLKKWYQYYLSGDVSFIDIYKTNCPYLGQTVTITDTSFQSHMVTIIDILPSGNLLVHKDNELLEFSAGEITFASNIF